MSETKSLTKQSFIRELTRSAHGKLDDYLLTGRRAAAEDPEFFAHLAAWNQRKGSVRDAKVALPVVALTLPGLEGEFRENALAHLALQSPRDLLRGLRFGRTLWKGHGRAVRRTVERYLRARESHRPWFERTALQHRAVLKELYALNRIKPSQEAKDLLFEGKAAEGSVFDLLKRLGSMEVKEAASTILNRKIPFLIAAGALGKRMAEPDLVLALIEQMTPTELTTNSKMLEKLGVKTVPALRGAYTAALTRAAQSSSSIFKTDKAVEAVEDEGLKEQLRAVQQKQLKKLSVEGNWLVLGDKSGSMEQAIEAARRIAATLASVVAGRVLLVFFDVAPRAIEVTGKDYDAVLRETRHVNANGGTSIGCGLQYAMEKGFEADGIAVVSDGAENQHPLFGSVLQRYEHALGRPENLPVYYYRLGGEHEYHENFTQSMAIVQRDLVTFDLRGAGVDWVSLGNLVQTMRTSRYSLVDEIMEMPLLTVEQALRRKGEAA